MARLTLFTGLLAACAAAQAADGDAMARIRARLDAHPQVRAEFVQTRRAAELQRPLVARGRMLVWGASGVIWEIEQPVKNTVALREDSTVQVDARGARTVRRAGDDAAAARIGRVLSALLKGDVAALEQWFEVAARLEGARWNITLTPRRGPLASFIQSMRVSGGEFVDAVGIQETGGDTTQIDFHNYRPGAPLSEAERDLLGIR